MSDPVEVEEVKAPSLIVPSYKSTTPALLRTDKRNVCLDDFGPPPFKIVLPFKILCHRTDDIPMASMSSSTENRRLNDEISRKP